MWCENFNQDTIGQIPSLVMIDGRLRHVVDGTKHLPLSNLSDSVKTTRKTQCI